MFKIISVTNRALCGEKLTVRIEKLTAAGVDAIIIREKDLLPQEYEKLARAGLERCQDTGTLCILHSYPEVAEKLGAQALHMPLPGLQSMSEAQRKKFSVLGASCHSVEDALKAQKLGCTYLTVGHIFATECKKGLTPRGLVFLRSVCSAVDLPVYAIGGIGADNIAAVRAAGAAGVCVMSGLMVCADPEVELRKLMKAGGLI